MLADAAATGQKKGAPAPPRPRAALRYTMEGDLRFLSHHDEMRMLARALLRAGWPVRFSEGFNPLPRFSIPLPRSVGVASTCQLAMVELSEDSVAQGLSDKLAPRLPAGCRLLEVISPAARGAPQPRLVRYELELETCALPGMEARIAGLLSAAHLPVSRVQAPDRPPRILDVRPFVHSLELDGRTLRIELSFDGPNSARPQEILTVLNVLAEPDVNGLLRTQVTWNIELAGPPMRFAAPERIEIGEEDQEEGRDA